MAATVNGNVRSQQSRFPEIVLDTTLAELLNEPSDQNVSEALCNIKPCADPRHKTVPLNKKYLITSSKVGDSNDLAHLQLENVNYLLSFWAGHMEVPMVACEGFSDDDTLTRDVIEQNALKAFSVLTEKQRPWPSTFTNKDHFVQHQARGDKRVRWGFAVDFAEKVSCLLHPEKQYLLNSKRWLANCPLLSANDRLIDPAGDCSTHVTDAGLWYFGTSCGKCDDVVEKELARVKHELGSAPLPYVLKLTQALGSVGTWLIKTEEDREKTVKLIAEIHEEALHHLNSENAHIYPITLIISDLLPGDTNALNFFVRRDGSIRFMGACQQLSTRIAGGGRQHTALTWDHQTKLESKFKATLADIGKVLHDEGYFGPCGADIMETEDGTQYVIDLNVRTTTSTILGCLRGHCEQRNFNACGVYECLLLSLSRDDLEKEFEKEFEEGRLILLGNTRLGKKDVWAYPVVVAGEDLEALKSIGAKILKFEAKTGGDAQDAGGA